MRTSSDRNSQALHFALVFCTLEQQQSLKVLPSLFFRQYASMSAVLFRNTSIAVSLLLDSTHHPWHPWVRQRSLGFCLSVYSEYCRGCYSRQHSPTSEHVDQLAPSWKYTLLHIIAICVHLYKPNSSSAAPNHQPCTKNPHDPERHRRHVCTSYKYNACHLKFEQ